MTASKKTTTKIPTVSVWARMGQVWTNANFLHSVLYAEKDQASKRTWAFWFLYNTLISVLGCAVLMLMFAPKFTNQLEQKWWPQVPEFEASVIDGKFSSNLPEPYVVFEDENFIAAIDSTGETYNENTLRDFGQGLIITEEKLLVREDSGEYRTVYFKEFEEDLTLTRADLEGFWDRTKGMVYFFVFIGGFMLVWFWLCIWRLATAAWWALIFWGAGAMAGIPDWSFGKSYLSVLNFYIIPLTFELLLIVVGFGALPFSTLLVFSLVFGVNFWQFKTHLKAA